jgi:predicted outer membrane repeat protein
MGAKYVSTDFLVMGGGVGGLLAAVQAKEAGVKRVTVVCKATAGNSGGAIYAAGNVRDWNPADTESIMKSLAKKSHYMFDQDWLEESIKKVQESTDELRRLGVKFIKVKGKEIRSGLHLFGEGKNSPNVWFDGGPTHFLWTLRSEALKAGVDIVDRVMLTDLLTSDGKQPTEGAVVGAVGFNVRNGDFYVFKAKATILSTGQWSIPRRLPPDLTGDGQAMALRVGATLRSMDLFEFVGPGVLGNPTTAAINAVYSGLGCKQVHYESGKETLDLLAAARGNRCNVEGGLKYRKIERKDYPTAESYGGPAWDDGWRGSYKDCTPRQLVTIYQNNPRAWRILEKLGVDIAEDLVRQCWVPFNAGVTPWSGGVMMDRNTHETNIARLFAIGDVADRAGFRGFGLSAATVGAPIAVRSAIKYANEKTEPTLIDDQVNSLKNLLYSYTSDSRKGGSTPLNLRHKLSDTVVNMVSDKGLFTNGEKVGKAVDTIQRLKSEDLPRVYADDFHRCMKANEMRNLLDVFPVALKAFMLRKESRVFAREDYPDWDNKNWLKFINSRLKRDGEIEFWLEDIGPMTAPPEE